MFIFGTTAANREKFHPYSCSPRRTFCATSKEPDSRGTRVRRKALRILFRSIFCKQTLLSVRESEWISLQNVATSWRSTLKLAVHRLCEATRSCCFARQRNDRHRRQRRSRYPSVVGYVGYEEFGNPQSILKSRTRTLAFKVSPSIVRDKF